jgi:hypothetical protein
MDNFIIFESRGNTYRMNTVSGHTWRLDGSAWVRVTEA